MNRLSGRGDKYEEVYAAFLSEHGRDCEKEVGEMIWGFCGTNLPTEMVTTTSNHLQISIPMWIFSPRLRNICIPPGKSPITFWVSSHPPAFSLNTPSPPSSPFYSQSCLHCFLRDFFSWLWLINLILLFVSVIACTSSSSPSKCSSHQMISSLWPGLILEPIKAGEISPGRSSQQTFLPIWLHNTL